MAIHNPILKVTKTGTPILGGDRLGTNVITRGARKIVTNYHGTEAHGTYSGPWGPSDNDAELPIEKLPLGPPNSGGITSGILREKLPKKCSLVVLEDKLVPTPKNTYDSGSDRTARTGGNGI